MKQRLQEYARLAVQSGVHLQKDQILLIQSSVEAVAFTRLVVEEAYRAGAKQVLVEYEDAYCRKFDYLYQSDAVLTNIYKWEIDKQLDYLKQGACILHIISPIWNAYTQCDPKKLAMRQKAFLEKNKEARAYTMASKVQWSIVACANPVWAKQVFPEEEEAIALQKLWDAIFDSVYIEENVDSVEIWKQRDDAFFKRIDWLQKQQFKTLHFQNSKGTDLTMELPKHHIWAGGSEVSQANIRFQANLPTEEIFTAPHYQRVQGIVYSSRPLIHNGNRMDEFWLRFENGKVVAYDAKVGKEHLTQLLEMDEGSSYLGEVALVPYDSKISQSKLLYYTTLFDENASCHLALGASYPSSIKDGTTMDETAQKAAGLNLSMTHVDFMFGTSDLSITGTKEDGSKVVIFEDGNFVSL